MRKVLITALSLLLIVGVAFAAVDTFEGQTGTDTWEGSSTVDTREGQSVATGGGGGSSCTADSEIAPDADVVTTGWTSTDTLFYTEVDGSRGSEDTQTYIQEQDNGDDNDLVLSFSAPGGCDIDSITVYFYGYVSGGGMDISFSVSDDNSTWEANNTATVGGGEQSFSFTSLGYSSPDTIYVRAQLLDTSWATLFMQNLAIVVNPS